MIKNKFRVCITNKTLTIAFYSLSPVMESRDQIFRVSVSKVSSWSRALSLEILHELFFSEVFQGAAP